MLVFGVAFVVALNVAARLDQPTLYTDPQLRYEVTLVRDGPGAAITAARPVLTLREVEDGVYARNTIRLRNWSILAVFGLAVASGAGGYVLSGMMLRPVRAITEAASQISASNLRRRINHQGPDDELKALADTFDSMIDRLEHSFEQQRRFVQDASHELRTPLAAIRTNIDVAEMDGEISPGEYRDLVETIKTQTARLTRLSEDLLLLSANEQEGQRELEPVSLFAVGQEVAAQLGPLARARNVAIAVEGDERVDAVADGDTLFRCVFNLVDNAIKYSGSGRLVTVRAEREAGLAKVSVVDNGPGIPEDEQAHVFERFFRVDKGRSRQEGGTGLGLAIVQELVTNMGGTVALYSKPGEGSTFVIRLPLAAEEGAGDTGGGGHGAGAS